MTGGRTNPTGDAEFVITGRKRKLTQQKTSTNSKQAKLQRRCVSPASSTSRARGLVPRPKLIIQHSRHADGRRIHLAPNTGRLTPNPKHKHKTYLIEQKHQSPNININNRLAQLSNPTRSSSRQGSSTSCIHLHILSSVSCHPGPAPQVDHPAPGCCHILVLSNILLPHEAVVTTISVRDFPWDASQREFVGCFSFSHGASEYSDNRVIGVARFSRLSTTPSRMHPVVHRSCVPMAGIAYIGELDGQ